MPTAPVFVRCPLPAPPERVFDLLTRADQLGLWLCDEASSDVRPGGQLRAVWLEEGQRIERTGTWDEVERPHLAVLRWSGEVPTGQGDETRPEILRFAIAERGGGSVVTVASPCPEGFERVPPSAVQEATRHGWRRCFDELAALLTEEQTEGAQAPSSAEDQG